MAGRIRTIKPEILDDEKALALSSDAWRLWVSSWVLADDPGRFRAASKLLAGRVFGDTSAAAVARVEASVAELVRAGFIRLYVVAGERFGEIKPEGWRRHQRIQKPSGARLPEPPVDGYLDTIPPDSSGGLQRVLEGSGRDHDHDHDHDHDRVQGATADASPPDPPPGLPGITAQTPPEQPRSKRARRTRPTPIPLPEDWAPSEALCEWAAADPDVAFDAEQVAAAALKMRTWADGNGATMVDWDKRFQNWLRKDRKDHPGWPQTYVPPPAKSGPAPARRRTPDPGQAALVLQAALTVGRDGDREVGT